MTPPNNKVSTKNESIKSPLKKNKSTSSSISPMLIVATVTSLSAIVLSIYNANQNLKLNDSVNKHNIKQRATTVKVLSTFEKSILKQQHDFSRQVDVHLKLQKNNIADISAGVLKLTKSKRGDDLTWKLQRAAYLISMAQLTLHWDKTTPPAISLLNSADMIIKSLNNPQLIGVRQSLNNEVTKLQSITKIDTTGILSKLNSLATAIENLHLKQIKTKSNPDLEIKSLDKTKTRWQQALDQSLINLSKIIVIRRHNIDFKPLISKQDKQLIINQLKSNLKQTQWALIHHKQQIYKFNLNQISLALNDYFDLDSPATKSVLKTITNLNNINISPTMPNINSSYKQLMEIINIQSNEGQA